MENMDKKECGGMCGSDKCGGSCCGGMGHMHGCHGGKHHLMRIILKLIIIGLIFCFGFNLGTMTGYIRSEYGYGRGMMGIYGVNNYGTTTTPGWGMMRGNVFYGQAVPSTTTPAPTK